MRRAALRMASASRCASKSSSCACRSASNIRLSAASWVSSRKLLDGASWVSSRKLLDGASWVSSRKLLDGGAGWSSRSSVCIGSDEAGAWAVPVVGVESECRRCAVGPRCEGASPWCEQWCEGASPTKPLRLPLRAMKNEATCPPARGDGGGSGVVASAQLFELARPLAPLAPSIPSSSASLASLA